MAARREPVWIDGDEVVAINACAVATFGGFSGEVRDETLLTPTLL